MKQSFKIGLIMAVALAVHCALATSYYVSAVGADGNSGTSPGAPWLTISKVNGTSFSAGDVVSFRGGDTFAGTLIPPTGGVSGRPIVFTSYGTGRAVINGGNAGGCSVGVSYVSVTNLNFVGSGRKNGNTNQGIYISAPNVLVDHIEVQGFEHSGVYPYNADYVTLTYIYAHDNGFAGICADGSSYRVGLYVGHCTADNNPGDPTVKNNHSGNGILIGNQRGALVEYCEASTNGWAMPWNGNGPCGIWCYACDQVTFQYCIAHDNKSSSSSDGDGFDLDGGTTGSTIQYCLSYNNQGCGYGAFEYSGATAWSNNVYRYCISVNDGSKNLHSVMAFWSGGGTFVNAQVYNNTFYNNLPGGVDLNFFNSCPGSLFCNNIFVANNPVFNTSGSGMSYEGNCYWQLNGGFSLDGSGSLSAWAAGKGRETVSNVLVGINANPRLVDPTALVTLTDPTQLATLAAFRLNTNSPCINAGLNLHSLYGINPGSNDFFGTPIPQGGAYDMGACELKAGTFTAGAGTGGTINPAGGVATAEVSGWDVKSDTWVATDGLGRSLPGYEQCGPPRPDRFVFMLYESWFSDFEGANRYGPYNIEEILKQNSTHPQWGHLTGFHYWTEPLFGCYLSDDRYVIRRHAQMFVAAGVDVMVMDESNDHVHKDEDAVILDTLKRMRAQGNPTPRVVFFVHTNAARHAREIYESFYQNDLNSDLWFRWEGKPLILSTPAGASPEMLANLTFRDAWGLEPINKPDTWSIMSLYPQPFGWHENGVPEEMPVAPCQQETYVTLPTAHGRSYHHGAEPPPEGRDYTGRNFSEQWERALKVGPKIVHVQSFNEWMGQRFRLKDGNVLINNDTEGLNAFVDTYSEEFSRDIEPAKGNHRDLYYYQLAGYVRRFKGVRAPEPPSEPKTIPLDGAFNDWKDVAPEYRNFIGDTDQRDHLGWGFSSPGVRTHYVNRTGRNNFVRMKVARDDGYLYFYAETRDPLTPWSDPNWMLLFLDVDASHATGWEGYDYLVNCPVRSPTRTTLKQWAGGGWREVCELDYRALGNRLVVRIPRAAIGLAGKPVSLDFHWADNIQRIDDINEFSINGDSAPYMGFNYRYCVPGPGIQ
jgi:hypothetical protein